MLNRIALWDGVSWSALGSGVGGVSLARVNALCTQPNGDLIAGGNFTTAGGISASRIARWDGTAWSPLGAGLNGTVLALATLPNGDLVAAGEFTTAGAVPAAGIARWNGTSWSTLGSSSGIGTGPVRALTWAPNGSLVAGGDFTLVDQQASAYLARLTTTCAAAASPYGAGCAGSGGLEQLTATSLPWVGGTFHATATGLPSTSLAVSVVGFVPVAIPLASLLAQGVAGCNLLVDPGLLDLALPVAGLVATQTPIPNSASLNGVLFGQQVVTLELDAFGGIAAVTSTNALAVAIGTF